MATSLYLPISIVRGLMRQPCRSRPRVHQHAMPSTSKSPLGHGTLARLPEPCNCQGAPWSPPRAGVCIPRTRRLFNMFLMKLAGWLAALPARPGAVGRPAEPGIAKHRVARRAGPRAARPRVAGPVATPGGCNANGSMPVVTQRHVLFHKMLPQPTVGDGVQNRNKRNGGIQSDRHAGCIAFGCRSPPRRS